MENTANGSVRLGESVPDDLPTQGERTSCWAIALSGGGFRAALFELGVLLYLDLADELKNASAVVSVSGGSILLAHIALNWQRAIQSRRGFVRVASELVAFTQQDIRNRAIIRWMWCHAPLFTVFWPSLRSIHFLRKQYDVLYANKTLQDLPRLAHCPTVAFVTTDPRRNYRVAFLRDDVWRIKYDGTLAGDRVLAKGTPISLAVAASSCFPPVFSRLRVTNEELRITWPEFGDTLTLTDGGVSGNLGIEVLLCLIENKAIRAEKLLVCDAEPSDLREPKDNLLTIASSMGHALSQSARNMLNTLYPSSKICALATRGPDDFDLSVDAVTMVAGYRTDLDRPKWQECYALMVHGAAIAHQQLGAEFGNRITPKRIRHVVRAILKEAGCLKQVPEPTYESLRGCDKRRYGRIIFHAILIGVVVVMTCSAVSQSLSALVWFGFPRPFSFVLRQISPEPIVPRDVSLLLQSLARAVCLDTETGSAGDPKSHGSQIEKLKEQLIGTISRMEITVGEDSNDSRLYVAEQSQPPGCERAINCRITFRGSFPGDLHKVNSRVTVTGRIVNIDGIRASGYIDVEECTAEPTP